MDMCIWICAAERFHYNQVRTGEENSHFWCSWVVDCDESSEPIPCLLSPCTEPGSALGLRPFQLLLLQNGLVWFKINLGFPLLLPPPAFLVPNAVLSVDISEPQRCLQTSSVLGSRRRRPNRSQYSDYSHLCCLIGSPRENYNSGPSSPCKTQISVGNQKAFCILMKTFGVKCGVFLEHLRAPQSSPPITHQGNGSGSS